MLLGCKKLNYFPFRKKIDQSLCETPQQTWPLLLLTSSLSSLFFVYLSCSEYNSLNECFNLRIEVEAKLTDFFSRCFSSCLVLSSCAFYEKCKKMFLLLLFWTPFTVTFDLEGRIPGVLFFLRWFSKSYVKSTLADIIRWH